MKILLTAINAKYIHSNLAVYSLRAYGGKFKDSIEIREFTINHRSEYILQEIYKIKPDVLCFSCYIWNYPYVWEIAAEIHKLLPDLPVWAGGPEVSFCISDTFLENPGFYGIMIGEGEASFLELAEHYCEGKGQENLYDIKGIAFRREGYGSEEIHITEEREPLDLSSIPFCYEDLEDFNHRIVYYESSRGCPFRCSYCLSSLEKSMRFRDLEMVKRELAFFIEREVPQVKFVDRTFNCNHLHAMEIWKWIGEMDRGITNFHFEIAADLLTKEELALLASFRPGLVQLEIGVQSTNEKTLREIRRTASLRQIEDVVMDIRDVGNIHQHLDLIAGLPYEGFDSFARSFREVYALKPNQLQLGFLKVLKGSFIYEKQEEYGILYKSLPPYEVMETKWLSYGELLSIKLVEEMLEVYYNSGQFEVTMKCLDVVYKDSFGFFLKLGEFYEGKGYLAMNHSRIRRCEILLEFLQAEGKISMDLVMESLLFDLYYRENIKSRPIWAINPSVFAQITRKHCKNGKLTHIEPFFYHFPRTGERLEILPERLKEEIYVEFDYKNRDALHHQAKVVEYRKEELI
ncbi:MAG: B12-binding domain-containing radical SAM protein [Lachnospiraceae bacterium]|nr:B12-binding domain-containing radical SAM protein [Lachnospiraceae bacterium]